MTGSYRVCVRCVMDTSDPGISFDGTGVCDYCRNFQSNIAPSWHTDERGESLLAQMAETLREEGRGRDFDCIIGLSGGLDSSYAALVVSEQMGLRPLLLHVDAGWNTDQAVENVECLVDGLGLDLFTEVIDWDEMRRLQVAFLRSGIPDQDLVQDAAFFSALYRFAAKYDIKHIITGSNYSTECCREPEAWGGYLGIDRRLFADIWRRYGDGKLEKFPLVDILTYKIWYQRIRGFRVHHPLNSVPYIKADVETQLNQRFGWKPFRHKHHESRFTRFFEDFWLPRRFGFDKRRAHFSSLIQTSQMTRSVALERLANSEMGDQFLEREFEYVASKLQIGVEGLAKYFTMPKHTYRDYSNKRWLIGLGTSVLRRVGLEKRYFR